MWWVFLAIIATDEASITHGSVPLALEKHNQGNCCLGALHVHLWQSAATARMPSQSCRAFRMVFTRTQKPPLRNITINSMCANNIILRLSCFTPNVLWKDQ